MRNERIYPLKLDNEQRLIYFPGDIVGVEGSGFFGKLSQAFVQPKTKLFHFLLIGDYIPDDDDYEIFESIGKGVAVGRLSWYDNRRYTIFRANTPAAEHLGKKAIEKMSTFGRMPYDYLLFVKFLVDFVRFEFLEIIQTGKFKRMFPGDFRRVQNAAFICTEFVVTTWDAVGYPVISCADAPVPSAFVLAVRAGFILPLADHDGNPNHTRRHFGHLAHDVGAWQVGRGNRFPIHRQHRGV